MFQQLMSLLSRNATVKQLTFLTFASEDMNKVKPPQKLIFEIG